MLTGSALKIIDFRARPNTPEYMRLFSGSEWALTWQRFKQDPPPSEPLSDFVVALDKHGIARAVFTGRQVVKNGSLSWGITNDYVAECVQQYPERLVGIAGIDPRVGQDAVKEVRRAVLTLGLRGISLDPDLVRMPPDDPIYYPVYTAASDLRAPVIVTMGPLVGRFAHPWAVDRVAEDFPDLTIVCSHGCWPQVTEFIALAYRRRNVYLEASIYEFFPGAEPIFVAAESFLRDRIIYASAFPFNPLSVVGRFIDLVSDSSTLEMLMHDNAARVLGLEVKR